RWRGKKQGTAPPRRAGHGTPRRPWGARARRASDLRPPRSLRVEARTVQSFRSVGAREAAGMACAQRLGYARPVSDDPRSTGEMTFLEHLDELRKVLVQAAAACLAGALAGWWLAPRVLEDIIRRTVKEAVVLSPLEAFNERFKLALLLGLFLALPIVLH